MKGTTVAIVALSAAVVVMGGLYIRERKARKVAEAAEADLLTGLNPSAFPTDMRGGVA